LRDLWNLSRTSTAPLAYNSESPKKASAMVRNRVPDKPTNESASILDFASFTIKKLGRVLTPCIVFICLMASASCKSPFERFVEHRNAGDDAYLRRDYVKAEQEYETAIKSIQGAPQDKVMLIIGMRSLAQVYIAEKKYGDAETIYQRRIALATESSAKDPVYLATVYDDLATFYILQNRIEEAKPLYERVLALTEEAYGTGDLRVAEKLEYYATLLKAKGLNADADKLEGKATSLRNNLIN
jgi:tetratricopeptide (TPR) repeat protein